jgi:cytochrome c
MMPRIFIFLFLCCLSIVACGQDARGVVLQAEHVGDPAEGRVAIERYGCGTCHVVPGVPGAIGAVGPPLTEYARRAYIAGNLQNSPENLIAWLQNPQAIEPGTAMPNLNVTEVDARNLTAYLATLR